MLEDLRRSENARRGYLEVKTPLIYDKTVWETSGHWEKFRGEMFLIAGEGEEPHAGLKPMNCPGHMLLFGSQLRSYRDLPLRYAESSTLHRNEPTGTLHGLLRVRHVTQDDAHIFCTREQIEQEIFGCLDYAAFLYDLFGMERALRALDPAGQQARDRRGVGLHRERAPVRARAARGSSTTSARERARSTGPKIDLHMKDVLGRSWQMGTIQLDAQMPKQFGLTYMGADNVEHTPYVVHRALLGSLERFMGILIEHYGGAFPAWLAPVQVRVVPVADGHRTAARELVDALRGERVRAEVDERDETLGKRIRDAELQKVPYVVVWGDRESREAMAVRKRGGEGVSTMSLDALVDEIRLQSPLGSPGSASAAGSRCMRARCRCYALPLQSRSGIAPHLAGRAPREVQPSRIRRGNAAAACSGVSTNEEDRLGLVNCL